MFVFTKFCFCLFSFPPLFSIVLIFPSFFTKAVRAFGFFGVPTAPRCRHDHKFQLFARFVDFPSKILGHQFNKSELMVSRTMKLKENLSVGLEAICLGRKTIRSIFVSFGRMFFLTSFGKTTFFLWKQKSPS